MAGWQGHPETAASRGAKPDCSASRFPFFLKLRHCPAHPLSHDQHLDRVRSTRKCRIHTGSVSFAVCKFRHASLDARSRSRSRTRSQSRTASPAHAADVLGEMEGCAGLSNRALWAAQLLCNLNPKRSPTARIDSRESVISRLSLGPPGVPLLRKSSEDLKKPQTKQRQRHSSRLGPCPALFSSVLPTMYACSPAEPAQIGRSARGVLVRSRGAELPPAGAEGAVDWFGVADDARLQCCW